MCVRPTAIGLRFALRVAVGHHRQNKQGPLGRMPRAEHGACIQHTRTSASITFAPSIIPSCQKLLPKPATGSRPNPLQVFLCLETCRQSPACKAGVVLRTCGVVERHCDWCSTNAGNWRSTCFQLSFALPPASARNNFFISAKVTMPEPSGSHVLKSLSISALGTSRPRIGIARWNSSRETCEAVQWNDGIPHR